MHAEALHDIAMIDLFIDVLIAVILNDGSARLHQHSVELYVLNLRRIFSNVVGRKYLRLHFGEFLHFVVAVGVFFLELGLLEVLLKTVHFLENKYG